MMEALVQRAPAVVGTYDDGDTRPAGIRRKGNFGEDPPHSLEREFRTAVSAREAEGPIFDITASAVPFVGPGKYKRPRAAFGECAAHLPFQRTSLSILAVS